MTAVAIPWTEWPQGYLDAVGGWRGAYERWKHLDPNDAQAQAALGRELDQIFIRLKAFEPIRKGFKSSVIVLKGGHGDTTYDDVWRRFAGSWNLFSRERDGDSVPPDFDDAYVPYTQLEKEEAKQKHQTLRYPRLSDNAALFLRYLNGDVAIPPLTVLQRAYPYYHRGDTLYALVDQLQWDETQLRPEEKAALLDAVTKKDVETIEQLAHNAAVRTPLSSSEPPWWISPNSYGSYARDAWLAYEPSMQGAYQAVNRERWARLVQCDLLTAGERQLVSDKQSWDAANVPEHWVHPPFHIEPPLLPRYWAYVMNQVGELLERRCNMRAIAAFPVVNPALRAIAKEQRERLLLHIEGGRDDDAWLLPYYDRFLAPEKELGDPTRVNVVPPTSIIVTMSDDEEEEQNDSDLDGDEEWDQLLVTKIPELWAEAQVHMSAQDREDYADAYSTLVEAIESEKNVGLLDLVRIVNEELEPSDDDETESLLDARAAKALLMLNVIRRIYSEDEYARGHIQHSVTLEGLRKKIQARRRLASPSPSPSASTSAVSPKKRSTLQDKPVRRRRAEGGMTDAGIWSRWFDDFMKAASASGEEERQAMLPGLHKRLGGFINKPGNQLKAGYDALGISKNSPNDWPKLVRKLRYVIDAVLEHPNGLGNISRAMAEYWQSNADEWLSAPQQKPRRLRKGLKKQQPEPMDVDEDDEDVTPAAPAPDAVVQNPRVILEEEDVALDRIQTRVIRELEAFNFATEGIGGIPSGGLKEKLLTVILDEHLPILLETIREARLILHAQLIRFPGGGDEQQWQTWPTPLKESVVAFVKGRLPVVIAERRAQLAAELAKLQNVNKHEVADQARIHEAFDSGNLRNVIAIWELVERYYPVGAGLGNKYPHAAALVPIWRRKVNDFKLHYDALNLLLEQNGDLLITDAEGLRRELTKHEHQGGDVFAKAVIAALDRLQKFSEYEAYMHNVEPWRQAEFIEVIRIGLSRYFDNPRMMQLKIWPLDIDLRNVDNYMMGRIKMSALEQGSEEDLIKSRETLRHYFGDPRQHKEEGIAGTQTSRLEFWKLLQYYWNALITNAAASKGGEREMKTQRTKAEIQ
jgi:hypothetical protein